MLERRVGCPQCGREIRLSEAELADKRGFCAFCDARFDILADMFIGDGPMREVPVSRVALLPQPPTSRRVGVESAAPDAAVVLRPQRSWQLVVMTLAFCGFEGLDLVSGQGSFLVKVFPILHLALGLCLVFYVIWRMFGIERIAIADVRLEVTRTVSGKVFSRTSLPLSGVVRLKICEERLLMDDGVVSPVHHVTVASSTEPPVSLGRSIGLDAADAEWLRSALEARLQRARA